MSKGDLAFPSASAFTRGVVRPAALALGLLALVGCPRGPSTSTPSVTAASGVRAGGVYDTHLHFGPSDVVAAADALDLAGVTYGLNLSGRWPGGPLEAQLEAARRTGRFVVATNLPWAAARRRDFPTLAVELLTEARQLGARALKIEKALGLGAVDPSGARLRVDDPWLDPIWATAGALRLPVVIHTGDPKAFWLPVDEKNERYEELSLHPGWSNHGVEGLPSFEELLAELTRVIARHPGTNFVAVHFGNNAEDPEWVGRQLDLYPNLHVDLAARLPELGRHDPKKLHALFVRHRRRILFGTDMGLHQDEFMLGSSGKEPSRRADVLPYFAGHHRWLETWDAAIPSVTPIQGRWPMAGIGLPDDALRAIYWENAVALFGLPERAPWAERTR